MCYPCGSPKRQDHPSTAASRAVPTILLCKRPMNWSTAHTQALYSGHGRLGSSRRTCCSSLYKSKANNNEKLVRRSRTVGLDTCHCAVGRSPVNVQGLQSPRAWVAPERSGDKDWRRLDERKIWYPFLSIVLRKFEIENEQEKFLSFVSHDSSEVISGIPCVCFRILASVQSEETAGSFFAEVSDMRRKRYGRGEVPTT